MKIALVDDDLLSLKRLREYIERYVGEPADCFESGESFLKAWHGGFYDIVILDIFMGEKNGVEVAKTIRRTDNDARLVFVSSSNEFAGESYDVNACYYLKKPFAEEQFKSMLDRLNIEEIELSRAVVLPDGQKLILRNVIYADFASHCVTFHNKRGGNIVSRINFAEIEPLLCSNSYFYSPSKGVIVNFYEVAAQHDGVFLLTDGTRIPISRRKSKDVLDSFAAFRFENLRKGGEGQ